MSEQSNGSVQGSGAAQAPSTPSSAPSTGSGSGSAAPSQRDQVGQRLASLTGVEYEPSRPNDAAGIDQPTPEVPADAGQTVQQGSDADTQPQSGAEPEAAPAAEKSDPQPGDEGFEIYDPFAPQGKQDAEKKPDSEKTEPSAEANEPTKIDKNAPVEQQLQHAEKLIGKQGQELGEARKQLQEMANYFQVDGEKVIPRLDKIVEAVPEAVVQEYLESKGLALVQRDQVAKPQGADVDPKYGIPQADLEKIINRMETDADLTFEEKKALIESDPDRLLDLKLEAKEAKKSLASRQQQAQEAKKQRYVSLVKQVQSNVKHFDQLVPSIEKYNGYDYANPDHRFELIYKAAEFDRIKSGMAAQLKKVRDEAIEFGRRQAMGLGDMASPGGHVPVHSDSQGSGPNPAARRAMQQRFEAKFL